MIPYSSPRPPPTAQYNVESAEKNYWYTGTVLYVGWGGVGMGMRRFKKAQQM